MISQIIKKAAIAALKAGESSFKIGNNEMPHIVRRSESGKEDELFPEGCSYVGEFLYGNPPIEYVVLKQTLRKD